MAAHRHPTREGLARLSSPLSPLSPPIIGHRRTGMLYSKTRLIGIENTYIAARNTEIASGGRSVCAIFFGGWRPRWRKSVVTPVTVVTKPGPSFRPRFLLGLFLREQLRQVQRVDPGSLALAAVGARNADLVR